MSLASAIRPGATLPNDGGVALPEYVAALNGASISASRELNAPSKREDLAATGATRFVKDHVDEAGTVDAARAYARKVASIIANDAVAYSAKPWAVGRLGVSPQEFAVSSGGVQLEWHAGGMTLEILVDLHCDMVISIVDPAAGIDVDVDMSAGWPGRMPVDAARTLARIFDVIWFHRPLK